MVIAVEKRCEPRHKVGRAPVDLTVRQQTYRAAMVDVSRSAACLNILSGGSVGPDCVGQSATAVVRPSSDVPLELECSIKRLWTGSVPTCVVVFGRELTELQQYALLETDGDQPPHRRELAKADHLAVQDELLSIQECRSNLFVGTLGALAAATMATWLAVSSMYVVSVPHWVLLGSGVAGLLLLVGILATVEKATAINLRKSFLRILCEFIARGQAPPSYCGWSFYRDAKSGCGLRRKVGLCTQKRRYAAAKGRRTDATGPQESIFAPQNELCRQSRPETCWSRGNVEALPLNRRKPLLPGAFDSFMSFTACVYGAGYVLVSLSVALSLALILNDTLKWRTQVLVVFYVLAAAAGAALMHHARTLTGWWRGPKDVRTMDQAGPGEKAVRLLSAAAVAATLTLIPVAVLRRNAGATVGLVALTSLGVFTGGLAVYLVGCLDKVRRGPWSVESLYAGWRRVFLDCQASQPMGQAQELDKQIRTGAGP